MKAARWLMKAIHEEAHEGCQEAHEVCKGGGS